MASSSSLRATSNCGCGNGYQCYSSFVNDAHQLAQRLPHQWRWQVAGAHQLLANKRLHATSSPSTLSSSPPPLGYLISREYVISSIPLHTTTQLSTNNSDNTSTDTEPIEDDDPGSLIVTSPATSPSTSLSTSQQTTRKEESFRYVYHIIYSSSFHVPMLAVDATTLGWFPHVL
jgi:hypothetical protein